MINATCSPARFPNVGGRSYENKRLRDKRERKVKCSAGQAGQGSISRGSSPSSLHSLIAAVADGSLTAEDATLTIERQIESQCSAQLLEPRQDNRVEVVDAEGMPTSQLAAILANLAGKQQCAAARHVDSEVYATIRSMLPGVQYHGGALMLLYSDPNSDLPKVEKLPGHVAIVCGSGADVQMAYEAKVALQLQGGYSTMMRDVSPTKLSDLVSRKEQLQAADAVIVCCGEQPSLAGLILGLVDVPVIAIPGKGARPDPNLAVSIQGACATAPGDGVSGANVAARTLHVAKQYIQHRKGREERIVEDSIDADPMVTPNEYLDRQPVPPSATHSESSFDSAFTAHVPTQHANGKAMNGTRVNGTAVNGVR